MNIISRVYCDWSHYWHLWHLVNPNLKPSCPKKIICWPVLTQTATAEVPQICTHSSQVWCSVLLDATTSVNYKYHAPCMWHSCPPGLEPGVKRARMTGMRKEEQLCFSSLLACFQRMWASVSSDPNTWRNTCCLECFQGSSYQGSHQTFVFQTALKALILPPIRTIIIILGNRLFQLEEICSNHLVRLPD